MSDDTIQCIACCGLAAFVVLVLLVVSCFHVWQDRLDAQDRRALEAAKLIKKGSRP